MNKKFFVMFAMFVLVSSFVSAGIGIRWERESLLVDEGEKNCMIYSVYNPFAEDSFAKIEVSDELKDVLVMQEVEAKEIPGGTSSSEAIPIDFCFKVPKVYKRDCWIGDSFICKQDCLEDQKIYDGEVLVKSVPSPTQMGGTGGSATAMAVSAPLNLKVQCNAHPRNFTLIYFFVALVAVIVIGLVLRKKYGRSKMEIYKDEMKALKAKMKKAKRK